MRDRYLTASHPCCFFHRTSALFSEAGESEKLRFLLCRQKKEEAYEMFPKEPPRDPVL